MQGLFLWGDIAYNRVEEPGLVSAKNQWLKYMHIKLNVIIKSTLSNEKFLYIIYTFWPCFTRLFDTNISINKYSKIPLTHSVMIISVLFQIFCFHDGNVTYCSQHFASSEQHIKLAYVCVRVCLCVRALVCVREAAACFKVGGGPPAIWLAKFEWYPVLVSGVSKI